MNPLFASEYEMVESSLPLLQDFFNTTRFVMEPTGLYGRPDVMVFNGDVISIEFKLKNWKRALTQAFRYRTFSCESYVFLDDRYSKPAITNIHEFELSNIGLCGVSIDGINVYFKPRPSQPYSDSMHSRAEEYFSYIE